MASCRTALRANVALVPKCCSRCLECQGNTIGRNVEVGHRSDHVRSENAEADAVAVEGPLGELISGQSGSADIENYDVGLHRCRVQLDPAEVGQAFGELPGTVVVFSQPIDVVTQCVNTSRCDDPGLPHGPAESLFVAPRPLDECATASEDGTNGGAEPLAQVDPDGIERGGELTG